MRTRNLLALPAAVVAVLATVVAPGGTSASCAMPPGLEEQVSEAEIVFVGTVAAVRNMGRTASFSVEEIWQGPDLPEQVTVLGGPEDEMMATSADRSFTVGIRYLVAAYLDGGTIHDNSCSATHEWHALLEELRPADARSPTVTVDSEAESDSSVVPMLLVAAGLAAVATLSVVAFRRGR